jgi:hypothetical protein
MQHRSRQTLLAPEGLLTFLQSLANLVSSRWSAAVCDGAAVHSRPLYRRGLSALRRTRNATRGWSTSCGMVEPS